MDFFLYLPAETRILVTDDESLVRWILQKNLEKAGYGLLLAETGEEALQKIRLLNPFLCGKS